MARALGRDDIITPNKPSKRTRELGRLYAPEFVCTPFKLTLGTFIESLERGATLLGIGGCNSYCRFGYYWPVQKLILEDLGYDFEFLTLSWESPKTFIKELRDKLTPGFTISQTIRGLQKTWVKNRFTDMVDDITYKYRPFEEEKGLTDIIAAKAFRKIVRTDKMPDIRRLRREIPKMFKDNVKLKPEKNPLKVAIIGEIYVVLEPAMNVDVIKRLNDLGVVVSQTSSLRQFLDVGAKLNPFKKTANIKARERAAPYLKYRVGGEAQESIGETIIYKEKGYDGMVHLYPFTCMPEIISRSILPEISHTYEMPVLSMVVDEQTGEAGFQTRLEAFVDLLARKRDKLKVS